jgi:outer membrane protein OmpA-like peptidoglycan-associated protein
MKSYTKTGIAILLAGLVGCGSLPERVDSLEQARSAVRNAEQDELANQVAATELAAARAAIDEADAAYRDRASLELIEHKAYLAKRYADISQQRIAEAHAKEKISEGEAARNRILLAARTREAESAEREARAATEQAQRVQGEARAAQEEAQLAAERNRELEQALADLQAKQTERGLVLTLGDVLFDTAEAVLKAGAASTMDRLAAFMRDYPDRNVMIEGHTDARGSEEYNRQLSEARAAAVRDALLERGINLERIRTFGLGEAFPVAGNDAAAGMQQNRRVEIVISDEAGEFSSGAQRTAAEPPVVPGAAPAPPLRQPEGRPRVQP